MTAEPNLPSITCPSSLIASCAPLLGFQPRDCLVAFVVGVPGRSAPVLVRLDLGDGSDALQRAADLVAGVAGTGGTQVDLVAWVDAPDEARRADLPGRELLAHLFELFEDHGLAVDHALSTNGRVWWLHDCPDELCCGASQPLDADVLSVVRAEYAYAGFAPLASRAELAARLVPDPVRCLRVAQILARSRPPANPARWREVQLRFLTGLLVPGPSRGSGALALGYRTRAGAPPMGPEAAARSLRGLADVVARDILLRRLAVCDQTDPEQWWTTVSLLCDLVRCAPAGTGAPAATMLALVAWLRGDGAMANLALDRADDDDPHYRLAQLSRRMIAGGMDPRGWRSAVSGLSEAQCRRP